LPHWLAKLTREPAPYNKIEFNAHVLLKGVSEATERNQTPGVEKILTLLWHWSLTLHCQKQYAQI